LRRESADRGDCADHRDHVRQRQAADAQLDRDQANSFPFRSTARAGLEIGLARRMLIGSALLRTCAYRKSHPALLMVQSAQDRTTDNASRVFGGARYRRILVQRQVSARAVVTAHVRQQHVAQMALAKYHDMISAFPAADRAD
jgi:hypothetical protein